MNRPFYKIIRFIGRRIFFHASTPRILHQERASRAGGYLLAANHLSPYDAPLLIATNPRIIHWLSIEEIFRNPLCAWFLNAFGAMPLRRGEADTRTVRAIMRQLRGGQVVGIFPEGAMRSGVGSVLEEGNIHEGICRLAHLARVPVVPCVVLGGEKFSRWTAWLPGARTRWAVTYGEAIFPCETGGKTDSVEAMAVAITAALRLLSKEVAGDV